MSTGRAAPPAEERKTGRRRYLAEGAACLLVLGVSYLAFGGAIPKVHFTSEVIKITVDERRLYVDALYRYRNDFPFPVTQGFSCPTPAGDGLRPAEGFMAVRIPETPGGEPVLLPLRRLFGAPLFEVRVPAGTETVVRVRYVQEHSGSVGKYLLTTTAPWGEPLEHGRYELTFLAGDLLRSNYPLESLGPGRYFFARAGFMPEEDWEFEFTRERR